MIEYFGTAGLLLAPLVAIGGLARFFISEFQGLHDIWTNEDKYAIVVQRAPTACATRDLSIRLGTIQAANETIYQVIDFTNVSGQTCTLYGYPGVSFAGGTPLTQIGAGAVEDPATARVLITLTPGAVASALLRYFDAAFFYPHASACTPRNATSIVVYPPNQTTAGYLADNVLVCVNPNVQMISIDAIKAGANQQALP